MGTSHQRYESNGIQLSHAVVIADFMLADSWSAVGVINGYSDGNKSWIFRTLSKISPVSRIQHKA